MIVKSLCGIDPRSTMRGREREEGLLLKVNIVCFCLQKHNFFLCIFLEGSKFIFFFLVPFSFLLIGQFTVCSGTADKLIDCIRSPSQHAILMQ